MIKEMQPHTCHYPHEMANINFSSIVIVVILYTHTHISEPVGAKAPAFPSEAATFNHRSPIDSTISLICQAQAYPVPIIR